MVRKIFERDGLVFAPITEFEMFETSVYVYERDIKQKRTLKKGIEKIYEYKQLIASINIPLVIVRHLNLKHKDKLIVAIYKAENFDITEEISNNDKI